MYFSWLKSLQCDIHKGSVDIFVKVTGIEVCHRLVKVYGEGHKLPQVRAVTLPNTFYHPRLPRTVSIRSLILSINIPRWSIYYKLLKPMKTSNTRTLSKKVNQ